MLFTFALLLGAASMRVVDGAVLGKRSLSGQATFYGRNLAGGACSFSTYTLPSNILGTALSDSNWDNAGNCGGCVSVTGPDGNSIIAMMVDECPGCGLNHLDLFPNAFADLANPTTGIIDVVWDYVACPITSPLSLHNKDGVSTYWFSMQVVNANKAVKSMDNPSGFGTTTVDVKVTSADGEVVIVNNVQVSSGACTTASSNFGFSELAPAPAAAIVSPVAPQPSTPVKPLVAATTAASPEPIAATASTSGIAASPASTGSNFIERSVSVGPAPAKPTPFEVVIVYVDECPA